MRKPLLLAWLVLAGAWSAPGQGYDPATAGREGLVLIANRNTPESESLARFYAEKRGVPAERVVVLDLPTGETMSRSDYEQRLRDPLLAALRELRMVEQVRREANLVAGHDSEWHTVKSTLRYVVPVWGVPLRIDDTKPWPLEKVANLINQGLQRDEAAVDSELSLLLRDGYDLRGRVSNPMYNQLRWEAGVAGAPLLLVSRLDGPEPESVRRMLEQTWRAEQFGLQGRVYVDQRAPHQDDYQVGDYWLDESALRLLREGYEVSVERTDAVMGEHFPMEGAAIYLGWYTGQAAGPFRQTNFVFRPGALAYHNHSGNAAILRSSTEGWCGPLLARGAAATAGAVSEPFLLYTPHVSILVDRLCLGLPWADAMYLALPCLSWQTTVVGDPLYRPFAVTLEEQIRRLEEAKDPAADDAHVRLVNRLARDGRLNPALRYLRERIRLRPHPVLYAKLADLYAQNELVEEAIPTYDLALASADSPELAVRIATRYLSMLDALGRHEARARVAKQVGERWAGSPFLEALPGGVK